MVAHQILTLKIEVRVLVGELLCVLLLPFFALAQSDPSSAESSSSALSSGEVTLAPDGAGGYAVTVDGKSFWPPKGDSCDWFVRCCDAGGLTHPAVNLACRMQVTSEEFDCHAGRKRIMQMIKEMRAEVPKACSENE